jgi:hypothetical protein
MLNARCWTESATMRKSSIDYPASHSRRNPVSRRPALWDEENLTRVRILYLCARRETLHIDVFARRKRTLHNVRLTRNRDAVRVIAFLRLSGHSRRRRRDRRLLGRDILRLRRCVRIEWLLLRRIFFGRRIACDAMMSARRLLHVRTRANEEDGEQRERQRELHKSEWLRGEYPRSEFLPIAKLPVLGRH